MKITITKKFVENTLPVFILKDKKIENHSFFSSLSSLDQTFLKKFTEHKKDEKEFTETLYLPSGKQVIISQISKETNHRKIILLIRKLIVIARKEKIKKLLLNLLDFKTGNIDEETLAEILATQAEIANFEFVQFKKVPEKGWSNVEEIFIYSENTEKIKKSLEIGKIIGVEINNARSISNMPGGDMTPKVLAESAQKAAKGTKIKIEILDEKKMNALGMGAVLGIGKGAEEKPKFIIMEYWGGKKNEKPFVLVGKGVTYDTGGLDIKTGGHMYEMHMDMTGGASAIHTIIALAKIGVKKNIITLVPAVENAASNTSVRPGDILKSMSGKTIEIINTDAEGRVILADALTYAKKYNPELVIDMATLTGAACAALGTKASAIFSENKKLSDELVSSGEITGDFVWPLPLWTEYEDDTKSNFADLANYKKVDAGASLAAVFLWQFAKDYPWVHIDIAPRMVSAEGDFLAKGNAAPGIALLTHFLRQK